MGLLYLGFVVVSTLCMGLVDHRWRLALFDRSRRTLGVVAEQRRHISLFLHRLVVAIPVRLAPDQAGKVIDLADLRAILIIESALHRPEPT